MVCRLRLQVVALSAHIEGRLDVLLVLESSKEIAQTGKEEKHRHYNQRGGLKSQTQKLDRTHQQVEPTPRPVVIKVADKIGEGIGQWTNTEQKRHLHEQNNQTLHNTDDGEDYHQVEVENVGDTKCQTQDDGEEADPLAVEGEVFLFEVQREPIENVGRDCAEG